MAHHSRCLLQVARGYCNDLNNCWKDSWHSEICIFKIPYLNVTDMVHSLQQRNALEMGSSTHSLHHTIPALIGKRKGSYKHLKHWCRSRRELYRRIPVIFSYTIKVYSYSSYHYWKALAEIMFGRNIKTRMDLLHPQSKERKQEKPKSEASFGKNARKLEVEDAVWMWNYRSSPRWIPGSITTKFGPRNYQVLANWKFHKRHIDQLRSRSLEMLEDTTHKYLDVPNEQSVQQENQPASPVLLRRYPQRENRRPPDRLTY